MLKQLELKLPRDIRKRASMSTLAAKVAIENRDPWLSGAEKLVTKDMEETKVFNDLFASVFTGKVCFHTSQPSSGPVGLTRYVLYRKLNLSQWICTSPWFHKLNMNQCATTLPKMDCLR